MKIEGDNKMTHDEMLKIMNKEIKDVAMWEENDSELAKYHIQQLLKTYDDLEEQYKSLMKKAIEQDKRINKAIEYIEVLDKNEFETIDDVIVLDNYLSDLLDILRGEDND